MLPVKLQESVLTHQVNLAMRTETLAKNFEK